uniref:Protein slowmo homolog 1-like n=1 Tax=Phallusia mammillata TaxID=59560 RepID=A0A6F9DTA6_9ASCI|nr:protein slowmo homolog 1-like [Phallusia mammillata]
MVFLSFDEHLFNHPWEKVVEAALRKYPNPETPNVLGTDVYERKLDADGKLHSKRIISSIWSNSYTEFMAKFVGIDFTKTVHAIECSVLDPKEKSFKLSSKNYNFLDYIVVDETLTYTPDEKDPNSTLLRQQWKVTCKNLSFTGFLENAMGTTMMSTASKGRQGIEFVINQVREEVDRLTSSPAIGEMQQIATNTLTNVQQSIGDMGKKWEESLHEELQEFINNPSLITEPARN